MVDGEIEFDDVEVSRKLGELGRRETEMASFNNPGTLTHCFVSENLTAKQLKYM